MVLIDISMLATPGTAIVLPYRVLLFVPAGKGKAHSI